MSISTSEPPIKAEDFLPESRNVSNSEVTTFLSCKRQYDFAFIENLEPIVTARHLSRGTIGHFLFEKYIEGRLEGRDHKQSQDYANNLMGPLISSGQVEIDVALEAQGLVTRYHAFHQGWPKWQLLGTEKREDLKLTDTLSIAIKYDLLYKDLEDCRTYIGDWKFTYDFWSPAKHAMHPQIPKYIAVMRANGYKIDGGKIFEVRTRKLGKEKAAQARNLWKETTFYPTDAEMTQLMRQHVLASHEIEEHRALDPDVRKNYKSIPVLNIYGACQFCAFEDPCNAMNKGAQDISLMLKTAFKPNSYGYNFGDEVTTDDEVGF